MKNQWNSRSSNNVRFAHHHLMDENNLLERNNLCGVLK